MRIGRGYGIAVIACLLALVAFGCGRSGGSSDDETQAPPVVQRNVHFETTDSKTLTGRLFGRARVGVVLAHMYPADARSWYPAAVELARAGYMALAFNFRGYADSEKPVQIVKAPIDIAGADAFLRSQGARDVVYVGASMGGTASIIAAQDQKPLAVVAVSAPTNFRGLDAPIVAGSVQRPVLLMASRGDTAAFDSLQELQRTLPNPDTRIYDGDAHGTALLDARPEAIDEIVSFLKRYAPLSRALPTPSSS